MLVGRITPAPSSWHCFAQATASWPTGFVPPETTSSNPEGISLFLLASMATATFSGPNSVAACLTRSRFLTAALFMEILLAPASRTNSISSMVEIPPPTVNGISITEETPFIHSNLVFRFSNVAAMSSIASSSAPSRW